ncbi:MAG: ThiF family adenylyltransferase [Clostridia bacterium]|nr:ThiF family adenylyltransferase [Clostridia bacterium]
MMLDEKQIKNLKSASIIVFGVGGVGSALCHFLVRSGIEHLTIVDFDKIDATNINRQLVAYQSNIGKLKVEELKNQLLEINPNLQIETMPIKLDAETIKSIDFKKYNCVIDCIDDIPAKKLLILECNKHKIYLLSAMGAGNRYAEIPQFEVADISRTSYDPIAKILRKFCVEERIKKLDVCYTKQKATKFDCKTIGSVVYYPVNMATVMCAKIINKIVG